MWTYRDSLTPNASLKTKTPLLIGWGIVALILWQVFKPVVFPSPLEVVLAFPGLMSEGLLEEVLSSLFINTEALILSALIGLPICYLYRVPAASPVGQFLAKMRFVGPAVFFLPLVFLVSGGHSVKVWLLTLGQLFYLVTTMNGVVGNISESKFDDARTLNMSEWLSVWYVVIRGTVAEAIDAIRDNAAIGWAMLMFVEGLVRSEGGIGVMIINMEKHVEWASLWCLITIVVLVGILQDYLIGQVRKVACPYAT